MRWDALPAWLRGSILLFVYFVGTFLSVNNTNEIGPDILIALIYPGAALNIVLLLVFGMRYWPALFFNPYVGTLLNEAFGQPHLTFFSVELFWYAVIQVIGFGGVCWIVQRLCLDARLVRTRDTSLVLLLTSFVGPLVVALLTIAVFTLDKDISLLTNNFILNTLNFWAGDATGVAMLAPILLIWFRGWLPGARPLTVSALPLTRPQPS